MTSLAARLLGAPDDPEDTPVATPQHPRPAPGTFPWYWGVLGMDPAIPVDDDWGLAAQCTAMACAVHVFGNDAGRPGGWAIPRKPAPAARMLDWLLGARSEEGAARRRLALRLACEHAALADADRVLDAASDLLTAVAPQR